VKTWLQEWLLKGPKFSLARSIFPALIGDAADVRKKASYSYGTKVRVTFSSQCFEDKTIYVNKVAPLELAFDKYCSEKKIDPGCYYFLFRGVELPRTMTASQFGLRNGSVVHVHPNEDKTSTEPLSITVVGVDGASAVFNVTKGKRVGVFLKTYCDLVALHQMQLRFTFNNEVLNDDLTFAEHNMKTGDQIFVHVKQFAPTDYMYHMLTSTPELSTLTPMQQPEPFDLPLANTGVMYNVMFNQPQRPPPLTQQYQAPYGAPSYSMLPPKTTHYPKSHDANPPSSIWESFDMNIN
jgi:hypothetical protein